VIVYAVVDDALSRLPPWRPAVRRSAVVRRYLTLGTALVVILGAVATPASGGSRAEEDDAAAIREMVNRNFAAYNHSLYYAAALFFARTPTARCGGIDGVAVALQRNARAERIRYSLVRLRVIWQSRTGTPVDADVYVRERDARTGAVLNTMRLGLRFVRQGSWKFQELFPVGTSAFCR
jgi:hypothetical protein